MQKIKRLFKRLHKNERGSVLIMEAGAMFVLISMSGAAVDFGISQIIQNRVQQASDAAALAGGNTENLDDAAIIEDTRKYFALNYTSNYMNSGIDETDLDVQIIEEDEMNKSVSISLASTSINTMFSNVIGFNTIEIGTHTKVGVGSYVTGPTYDMVLVYDISCSMTCPRSQCKDATGKRKIDTLRRAATNLVNDISDGMDTTMGINVAMVRFHADVFAAPFSNVRQAMQDQVNLLVRNSPDGCGGKTHGDLAMWRAEALLQQRDAQLGDAAGEHKYVLFLTDGRMTKPKDTRNQRILDTCRRLKEWKGTKIFTFGFGKPGNYDEDLLRNCASGPKENFFFEANSEDALTEAFEAVSYIANNLRITE